VYRVELAVRGDEARETEATARAVLYALPTPGLAKDVLGDPEQPRQCGTLLLVAESPSVEPRSCEHFGGQIEGLLSMPRSRPREDRPDVPVVDLRERVTRSRAKQLCVGSPGQVSSHNQYMSTLGEVCHLT